MIEEHFKGNCSWPMPKLVSAAFLQKPGGLPLEKLRAKALIFPPPYDSSMQLESRKLAKHMVHRVYMVANPF
jgi:hypothetical protein